jgi:hypothetical protein
MKGEVSLHYAVQPLPEFRKGMVPSLRGWEDFFASRLDGGSENEEGKFVLDPQMIDGAQSVIVLTRNVTCTMIVDGSAPNWSMMCMHSRVPFHCSPPFDAGLSFPLSFLWALRQLLVMKAAGSAEVIRRKVCVVTFSTDSMHAASSAVQSTPLLIDIVLFLFIFWAGA